MAKKEDNSSMAIVAIVAVVAIVVLIMNSGSKVSLQEAETTVGETARKTIYNTPYSANDPECGDGRCDEGETCDSCPSDCTECEIEDELDSDWKVCTCVGYGPNGETVQTLCPLDSECSICCDRAYGTPNPSAN